MIEPIEVPVLPAIPSDTELAGMSLFELRAKKLEYSGMAAAIRVGSYLVPSVTPYGSAAKTLGREAFGNHMEKIIDAIDRAIEEKSRAPN